MKKLLRTFFILSIFTFFLSCSTESENLKEIHENSTTATNLQKGTSVQKLKIGSNTYLLNPTGYHKKYINGNFEYEFKFSTPLNYIYTETQNEFKITNGDNSNQKIKLTNLIIIDNNNVSFDIETSSGYIVKNVVFEHNSNKVCWWCIIIPVVESAIESIIKSIGDNYDSNCALAIEACEFGVQSIQIIDQGWFSPASCTVICK
ncbi:hypothetical protein [Hanstruepera marina]|uniref:hypothetical protein n=1 Tax=Hanstruepera marina TaxID=2873265 RepID=UPI001CA66AF2|nr:hypothetical protein [Hanstruepera marina]